MGAQQSNTAIMCTKCHNGWVWDLTITCNIITITVVTEYSLKYTGCSKNSMHQPVYVHDALCKVCMLCYNVYIHSYSQSCYYCHLLIATVNYFHYSYLLNPRIAMNFLHTYLQLGGGGKLPPRCISGSVPPRDKIPQAIPMLSNVSFSMPPTPTLTGDSFAQKFKMAPENRMTISLARDVYLNDIWVDYYIFLVSELNATIFSLGPEFARNVENVQWVIWAVWGNFPL